MIGFQPLNHNKQTCKMAKRFRCWNTQAGWTATTILGWKNRTPAEKNTLFGLVRGTQREPQKSQKKHKRVKRGTNSGEAFRAATVDGFAKSVFHFAPFGIPTVSDSIPQRTYERTMVSYGFIVVRNGFRPSTAWILRFRGSDHKGE